MHNSSAPQKPSIAHLLNAKNARKVIAALLKEGTGWLLLGGVLILLTADIWLGASVLQAKGMDKTTSYLFSIATSALQIALFQRGTKIMEKARTNWQLVVGGLTLGVGWIVVVGDSFLDGSASFLYFGGGLPSSWEEIVYMLADPYVSICFVLFFILSFLGERLARLIIFGEHDEEDEKERSTYIGQSSSRPVTSMPARPMAQPIRPMSPAARPIISPAARPPVPARPAPSYMRQEPTYRPVGSVQSQPSSDIWVINNQNPAWPNFPASRDGETFFFQGHTWTYDEEKDYWFAPKKAR